MIAVIAAYATFASAEPGVEAEYAAYHNDRWHFSLAVPGGMTVGVHDQAGGGQTIQFVDAEGAFQFQDLTLDRIGALSNPTTSRSSTLSATDILTTWQFIE